MAEKKTARTGLDFIGDIAIGSHICQFYRNAKDLTEIAVPFFKAGLESNEFCLWIVSKPLMTKEAIESLSRMIPDLTRYLDIGQMEIIAHSDWYNSGGSFNPEKVLNGFTEKLKKALKKGFRGMRIAGSIGWLEKKDWSAFAAFEESVSQAMRDSPVMALCSYPVDRCGAFEVIDVVRNHHCAIIKTGEVWHLLQCPEHEKAEQVIRRSEEKYRDLVENTRAVFFSCDENGVVTYVSPAIESLAGYRPEEEMGRPFSNFIYPEDLPRLMADFQKVAIGATCEAEIRITTRSGEARWVNSLARQKFANGQFTGFEGVLTDITHIKRAEEVLRQSEERYRDLVEQVGAIIFILDRDARVNYISPATELITGYNVSETTGQLFTDYVYQVDLPYVRDQIQKVFSGEVNSQEFRIVSKTGALRWLSMHSQPVFTGGTVTGIRGIATDITELKSVETMLRESEAKYRDLVENLRAVITTTDRNGLITYISPAIEFFSGYSPQEIIGRHLFDFFAEEDLEKARNIFNSISSGQAETGELRVKRKNNKPSWIHISARPTFLNDQFMGVHGVAIDIDHVKQAEEEIRRHYEAQTVISSLLKIALDNVSLDKLLEQVLDIILSIQWIATQPRACIFLVEDRPEVLVMKTQKGIAGQIQDTCARVNFGHCLCGRAALTRQVQFADYKDEHHQTRFDGMVRHGHYCVPITYAEKTLGVVNIYLKEGHCRDQKEEEFLNTIANTLAVIIMWRQGQSENEKVEAELNHSQKMEAIGRLAGGVAHDFNNLMTVISGYSELALNKLGQENILSQYIKQITKAVEQGTRLTQQLLAFSRKQVLRPEILNINDVVTNTINMLGRLVGEDIKIITELEPELCKVEVDRSRMEQVIMNLAVNARDAMPEGGRLTIRTENTMVNEQESTLLPKARAGEYACLSISDTGIGMDSTVLSHLFEPFFTTKKTGIGSGLGLSTVYGVIKQHEGWIDVSSKPGHGSTFKVFLPACAGKPGETGAAEVSIEEPGGRGERILLVEDDTSVRNILCRMLKNSGYVIVEAASAEEAMTTFNKEKGLFDMVFTDIVLPEKNGFQLVKELHLQQPDLPVLMGSGYPGEDSQTAQLRDKGFRFIAKPYLMNDLLHAVREVIDSGKKSSQE